MPIKNIISLIIQQYSTIASRKSFALIQNHTSKNVFIYLEQFKLHSISVEIKWLIVEKTILVRCGMFKSVFYKWILLLRSFAKTQILQLKKDKFQNIEKIIATWMISLIDQLLTNLI
jgi:hypothetical protein